MTDLGITEYCIAIVGGIVAGSMNTLAGYGSVITLTILMDLLGLPPNIANGSNRVNVLSGVVASGVGFYKNGKLDLTKGGPIILLTLLGAIVGIWLAVTISDDNFKSVFKYLVVVLLVVLLARPKRWLREHSEPHNMPIWQMVLVFVPLGFYGGFIQMGMGLFFVAATVLIGRYSIIESNALKVSVVGLYTVLSLVIFHVNGLVDWKAGALVGIGAAIGGYFTADIASRYKNANLWAYRLLVVIIVAILLRSFGVLEYIL